jgi:hypothetical protein
MFFLIGRRYPWLSIVVGAVMLAIGVSTGYVGVIVVGCLGLAFGGLRCAVAVRRRGIGGLFSGPGGAGGMGGFGGFGGTLR